MLRSLVGSEMCIRDSVIPGRAPRSDWLPIEQTKFQMELPDADQISELCLFLTGEVPASMGLAIYWSLAPDHDQFALLGAITVHRPSDVFRVAWSKQGLPPGTAARLGVSVEPLQALAQMEVPLSSADNAREFTQGLARDLFHYLQSHDHTIGPEWTAVLDKWYQRVEGKLVHDPMFWKPHRRADD
eukprot:TRINITY_DN51315_c0_g1_i1.p1 TRINITY_DN51315_c0_g1~~TRINITY_DN51315_c0_g1_i1.p1  ORF type:complete len:216 (-),score=41.52 TRINITY_DN51315_c0_g1_i1:492-1049(-)